MKRYSPKQLRTYVQAFLKRYPLFFAFIRSQEAYLFDMYRPLRNPILDFGCGDGYFAKIALHGDIIDVGLDLQKSRINQAEKEQNYKNLTTYDGNTIPYPHKHFQTAISNCVLEHIPHLEVSLKEISRVLKPGGLFLTSVMTDRWEDYLVGNKIFGKSYARIRRIDQDHHNLLSYKQWRNVFKQADFEVVEEIGYLSPRNAAWLDVMHYASFLSLPLYMLTGRWVIFPKLYFLCRIDSWITQRIQLPVDIKKSAALFYILKKRRGK
ncbi:hypothetical protein A3H80_00785 [Candidatus Roizmanbacteria bacterium RIFCSPLOWO2_02_FULL_37_19]|uniref:Methyltransferase type 11 domain-containing protein n=1 Tax=Candidatus Roizmanbacteria bacterium RIFCSPHIGHO2_02_FULL_37_24 TaxID=1802037 RepID=A0A1F7GUW0_9BACT|nr:MAG: hypothetical protein A2862_00470 [Candidatus Roizmanbacteria bacterium RIFCSPHIGHO2_01_FULL_38_41]OGK22673.1 MAG: hypothetical protein A3C24_00590 [Candidatus Roizmanbacteria bacterium RIFCSPHIGHO2_02_FULL_37_24]OGK32523.1 MAG: hypothetical protein A3E10_00655 [Candidatus Roizmanbacteria bacterium RIFCSPHIGHO2_12_FULL_37_23]OGK54503.1 MAG: hypothetical protein A3H80_00785 [Candidatus Roizmanbacteria bacterium RIFCSPLOWO2_02_FULL_37_19]OGK60382.1 MAG: hypothetical protein A3G65_04680 [Ca